MTATYTPNTDTDVARYAYHRRATDGATFELVARYSNPEDHRDTYAVVVGTATEEDVRMFVGRGAIVHDGTRFTDTITVAHTVESDNPSRPATAYAVGDVLVNEPHSRCGSSGTLRAYAFARNTNRASSTDAKVTCSKCLKWAAKRA